MVELVKPALEHLPSYKAALERGWSPDNVRLMEATREQLAAIEKNPTAFLADLDDPEAKGGPITLPDGTKVPRLPGVTALDLGRRSRRLDRPSLAARHRRAAATCARPHRLCRSAMEAAARPCDRGSEADARRGEGARACPSSRSPPSRVISPGRRWSWPMADGSSGDSSRTLPMAAPKACAIASTCSACRLFGSGRQRRHRVSAPLPDM